MIDRFEKFSCAISEVTRCWHKIAADEMEKHGLKGPYAIYFTTMYHNRDGITAARLAEYCGKDKADVSRAISVMHKKGLVERERTTETFYRAKLVLTDKGRSLAEIVNNKAGAAVEFAGRELTEENRKIFYDSLDSIITNLKVLSKNGI